MENIYLNVFTFLLSASRRQQLTKLLDSFYLEYPYDILWEELKKLPEDITKTDFLSIVKDTLSGDEFIFFKDMEESVSNAVGYRAINTLYSNNRIHRINSIIQSDDNPDKKLEQIANYTTTNLKYGASKSKKFSDMEITETTDLFYLFHYGLTKEELAVICAFTGRGKTSIMLSFIRDACVNNLKTLYISIKDFSETMLRKRLSAVDNFPDFYACCYSDFSTTQLELEIDTIKPDIVFLDYLGVMTSHKRSDQRRYDLENITSELKRLAQDKNIIIVTAHQLNKDEPFPKADDLLEAKAGIISHADLVLGVGGDIQSDFRNVTTIKARRHPALAEFLINFNFNSLTFDYENYEEKE